MPRLIRNVSGTLQDVQRVVRNVGGTLQDVKRIVRNVGGVLQDVFIFSGINTAMAAIGGVRVAATTTTNTLTVKTDGTLTYFSGTSATANVTESWLTTIYGDVASNYKFKLTATSGVFDSNQMNVFTTISANQTATITATTGTAETVTFTLEIQDLAGNVVFTKTGNVLGADAS